CNLLGFREPGIQHVEQRRGRDAADGELRGAVEKPAAVDIAVDVGIEEHEQIRIEIGRRFPFHVSLHGRIRRPASGDYSRGEQSRAAESANRDTTGRDLYSSTVTGTHRCSSAAKSSARSRETRSS